jgi:Tol biopolymer transport system component
MPHTIHRLIWVPLIVLMSLTLSSTTLATSARATVPGRNGNLAFMRQDAAGFWQVWVSNADLSGAKQLTHEAANSGWPVWSPDGQKIAFDTDRGDADPGDDIAINDVFTMNADRSSVQNVTGSQGVSGDPGWSPDGSSITFESDRGAYPDKQGIYVIRPDGTHLRRITTLPADATEDHAPRFSPDGRRIVFTRFNGDQDFGNSALFSVDLGGRHVRQLTSFTIGAGDADWSPDGTRIVFEASPNATSRGDVYVIRANGKQPRNLTRNPPTNGSADPVWAPDGTKILFLQGIAQAGDFVLGLATMNPDGTNRHFISANPIESHQPDWQTIGHRHPRKL